MIIVQFKSNYHYFFCHSNCNNGNHIYFNERNNIDNFDCNDDVQDAIDLLTPMLEDMVDFVRQGALISMALVLQQTSEARSPSVKRFRELIAGIVTDKHQPILAKAGAILAAGILDAGGCNVVLSMQSRAGFMKMVYSKLFIFAN